MPQTPNFKPGVGRLATDRYDFNHHVDGTATHHVATSIDLSPSLTIGVTTYTDVQSLLAYLSNNSVVPTVPDATTISKGVIQLGGDLVGTGTSALAPKVSGLQGFKVSNIMPDAMNNNMLVWNDSTGWTPSPIASATNLSIGGIKLLGDLQGPGGSAVAPKVSGLQGFPIDTATPSADQVLTWNSGTGKWTPQSAGGTPAATGISLGTVQLAGDLAGTGSVATAPRVSAINSATVPAAGALTTGNVLQVSGASSLTYNFISDANISPTAAIAGSKITPNFGSQALTAGVSSLGNTTTGTLTAGISTSVNTLTGSIIVTTRTVSTTPFTVDTTSTDYILFVNTTSLAITINLPTPTNGRRLVFKDSTGNAGTNNISIAPHAGEKIEGLAATKILGTNWGSWTFVSNGTDWFMI